MNKRIYRSNTNKVIAGVCGGLAEYFRIDPIIVRIVFILVSLASFGTGMLAYIIAVIIIPRSDVFGSNSGMNQDAEYMNDFKTDFKDDYADPGVSGTGYDPEKTKIIIGAALILFGLLFFAQQFLSWFDMRYFWPVLLVAIGGALIYKGSRRN